MQGTHLPGVLIFNPRADIRMKSEIWSEVFKVLCEQELKHKGKGASQQMHGSAGKQSSPSHHAKGNQERQQK